MIKRFHFQVLAQFPNLVDVNCRGVYGKRAIHWAGKYDYAECVEVLLKNGSRLCEPCDHGFYPIHVAAIRSSLDALEAMLKYGKAVFGMSIWLGASLRLFRRDDRVHSRMYAKLRGQRS